VIESDKASMEVPATCDGILQAYAVQLGDRVSEGTVIATLSADATAALPVSNIKAPAADSPVSQQHWKLRSKSVKRRSNPLKHS